VRNNRAFEGHYVSYANNQVAGVPKSFFNAGIKYASEMLKGAYVRIGVQNVGKYFVNDANTIVVPAYTIFNASIGIDKLEFANGLLYCSAFLGINNLTDKKYVGSAWLNPDLGRTNQQPAFIEPGLPRNFVGSIGIGMNL
jgi:iron complex outermembrane receptor protein